MKLGNKNSVLACIQSKLMGKKEYVFVIALSSGLIGSLLGRFFREVGVADFFSGLFTGLSLVFLLYFLVLVNRERRERHDG